MSRQVVDAAVLDSMLKQKGMRVPQRPCCGKVDVGPTSYARYLKQLGYSGKVAVRKNGVITEIVDL